MSHSVLAEHGISAEDLKWIRLDDGQAAVATTYGSVFEMRTAPIRLNGLLAARVVAAKERRLPQVARPLPLD